MFTELVLRDGELVDDHIAEIHQVIQPLLEHVVHVRVVWSVSPRQLIVFHP